MTPESVLVLEHSTADVTLGGLLLVRAVDVRLGAQLGAVGTDELHVRLSHVLLEEALCVEHLGAFFTGPLPLILRIGMTIPHVLLEIPKKDIQM